MTNKFSFPTFTQMYPNEKRKLKRLREFLRYQYRRLLHHQQCQAFEVFLNKNPLWQPLFVQYYYRLNALLSTYCDKRFNAQQRLEAIEQNLLFAQHYFGKAFCEKLIKEKSLLISSLTEELGLYLNINDIDPLEGFFSLNIRHLHTQERIYDASFSFLSPDKLLIASIQGPSHEKAQDSVRSATKQLHGVRPMFMLVNAFKYLAKQAECHLVGIVHKHQAKYRFNDSARLLFNYDQFWQENHGILQQDYWLIPQAIEQKALEDIPSKKRSMYRKRYEMLDQLEQDFHQLLA